MLLKAPLQVFWCLTDRCNLQCNFCLSESDPEMRDHELSATQRAVILNQLIENRVLKVYLTGGEPLLIPETLEYVRRLRNEGVFTVLTTNGILLDRTIIRDLAVHGINRIQVSLHGATAETNDVIMGGPAFDRIIQALGWIRETTLDLHIKVTLTRENAEELPRLIRNLAPFSPALINVSELVATGRGFENYGALRPSFEALQSARNEIASLREEGLNLSFKNHSLPTAENGRPGTCTVGSDRASSCLILPNGNMTPCTPAHVWGLSNKVLEYGLRGAWHRLPLYREFLAPEKLQGRCKACDVVEECKGGCRAEAYLYTRNVWGEYPACVRLSSTEKEQTA
jgi:radical SAM protein with 4Fe4S-binding SPASM domain